MNVYQSDEPFSLESGAELPAIDIGYHTYGKLNEAKNNVIWICHALTANSNPAEWWSGLIGEGRVFDTTKYFIVCANILGSCYGTTGPLSHNPKTGIAYYHDFPLITIRDMIKANQLLATHLGIQKIQLLVGGSMGGYQVLEWCAMEPSLIEKVFVITTSAKETAWGIAIHTSQRLAIEADDTWRMSSEIAGQKGLKAARAFGMVTYRSYKNYIERQTDEDENKLDNYKASSYINYQGQKLVDRFNAFSYWYLTKAMDNHNIARNRTATTEEVLKQMPQKFLIIGITSDILCPVTEQKFLAEHIPNATFVEIDSLFGHDGFLVETEQITKHLRNWM